MNSLSSVVVALLLARSTANVKRKQTIFTSMVDVVNTLIKVRCLSFKLTKCVLLELLTCATGKIYHTYKS